MDIDQIYSKWYKKSKAIIYYESLKKIYYQKKVKIEPKSKFIIELNQIASRKKK